MPASNEPIEEAESQAEAPVAEQAPKPKKLTFTAEQQIRIETLLKAASKEARAEAARLRLEIEAAKKPVEADTNLLVRLAQVESERDSLKAAKQEAAVRETLQSAAGDIFLDSGLAVRLMKDSIRVSADGVLTVVDESGAPRLNNAFENMSVQELAAELASQKPFLAGAAHLAA